MASEPAKPSTKSTPTSVEIATRLLTEIAARGLKADPVMTAWTTRKNLPRSINKLGRWLERFTAALFLDASRENQQRFLDDIGIERLLESMSQHMLDLLRERVGQDELHRRRLRGGAYARVTDWIAGVDRVQAWGRTKGEALRRLKSMLKIEENS
jgi:hypothetical protein